MKELKSIFGVLLLLVGGFVLFKVLPAYWGNYKLGRLLDDQSIAYTYTSNSPDQIATAISEKAQAIDVPLSPEQVTVHRTPGDLSIAVDYTVHVDLPIYPLDLNFHSATKNHNVMRP
jgi:hypothetical protein